MLVTDLITYIIQSVTSNIISWLYLPENMNKHFRVSINDLKTLISVTLQWNEADIVGFLLDNKAEK